MGEKMYLGLDMGTNSVGWAVTDESYQLVRAKGKDLWGARLFDEAQTSAERRMYRISRRRRQREKARLGLLREYFADAIDAVDPGFYQRLDESKYFMEDRGKENQQPYALFSDKDYTDQDYYRDYPTIFHLRKELLESQEKHDVRLVYLALANMFKHRGHFLNASLNAEGICADMCSAYTALAEKAEEFDIYLQNHIDTHELELLLGEKGCSRSRILENVSGFMEIKKKQKPEYEILCLICGLNGKMRNIFGEEVIDEEHKNMSVSFRDSDYEEKADEIREYIGDEYFELIEAAKEVHDIGLLANIMKGHPYLTIARVEAYEEHQRDLKQLKDVFKRYDRKAYHDMFRIMKEGNYSAYVGSVNSSDTVVRRNEGKGRKQEELYKTIKAVLKRFPQEDTDVQEILKKIDNETFLPKQLTASNGVIPNQVYVKEMQQILRNAEEYLPFLVEKDASGLTVSQRILQIFSFQLPYYIGPLGQQYKDKPGYNVWAERIAPGKIYPWNINEKIDMKLTAEKFINRTVRHCTYLNGEKTLPKNSLLYEKFTVLNELNNLRINGEKPSVEIKQQIYTELFLCGKKVSLTQLENWLKINGIVEKNAEDFISGIDDGFHNALSSHGKFIGVLGDSACYDENREMIEQIIFWATIYGNDKKFVRERIQEKYGDRLDGNKVKRILGFKFDGWGNLSEKFLNMEGTSKKDGQRRSIICAMWETNDNLMELMGEQYTYRDTLNSMTVSCEKPLAEWTIEDLDGMYLSAPVKRMVWQTMKIMKELQETLQTDPDRIFVEMPREEGEKGVRKASRKQKLLELYRLIRSEEREWKNEIESRTEAEFRSKKLYLYYLQMGRCMYTGEEINLDDLFNDNLYDIDHIYPRHFVKDDSIENNLVLVRKEKNAHKSDTFPLEEDIRKKQHSKWKILLDRGFITREKYSRLTRTTQFTGEEKAAFISRQLVETRQGTKAITQILQQAFPNSVIVFSKAGVVSDFRQKFDLQKVRCVNDFHHAQDAYLNIVVGNTYYVKFTSNPLNFIREAEKNPQRNEYKYNMDKIFEKTVQRGNECAWSVSENGERDSIRTVKKVMTKNSPLITRRSYVVHGGITGKATVYGADKAKEQGYIPVKSSDSRLQDVKKYGGLTAVTSAGYSLVEYEVKGKCIRSLEAIPVYLGNLEEIGEQVLLEYLQKALTVENNGRLIENLQIRKKCIRMKSLVKCEGYYYYLAGKTGTRICLDNAVPLCLNAVDMKYIKKMEKAMATEYYGEKDKAGNIILTPERNKMLYQTFQNKLKNTIYCYKKGSIGGVLDAGAGDFEELTLKDQCYVIMQILNWFQLANYTADLRLIGGSEFAGKCLMSKKISDTKEMLLFDESSAGLFRCEIDLLTV
ncbi:MAG: type II CRISPR RNA-guided endonuclease Cas9 [Roseburia sp.]